MKALIVLILLVIPVLGIAQFPFEKYPRIVYDAYPVSSGYDEADTSFNSRSTFIDRFKGDTLSLAMFGNRDADSSNIFVYRNNKLIQAIVDEVEFTPLTVSDSIFVGDINNDRMMDVKILCSNPGCGLAAALVRKIYLIGKADGSFSKYSFMDFSQECERDFDGDGNFEIIGVDHVYYNSHSYWVYDLFSLKGNVFRNVSFDYNYPIMIQYLFRKNYFITDHVSRDKMRDFSVVLPRWYDERK